MDTIYKQEMIDTMYRPEHLDRITPFARKTAISLVLQYHQPQLLEYLQQDYFLFFYDPYHMRLAMLDGELYLKFDHLRVKQRMKDKFKSRK